MLKVRLARAGLVLAATVGALAARAPALAQDLDSQARQRLYYEVKPAVVLVWASAKAEIHVAGPAAGSREGLQLGGDPVVLDLHAEISTFGSGWLISPEGYLVTNGHVIQLFHDQNEDKLQSELFYAALEASGFFERQVRDRGGAPGADALTNDKKIQLMQRLLPFASFKVEKSLDVYLQNWRRYPAEVKEYSPPIFPFDGRVSVPGVTLATGKDVAVLKIEGRDLPTMTIGNSDRMTIGDAVSVAGYPAVASFNDYLDPRAPMQASFTRGQVSSLKVDVKGSNLVQIDAAISSGSSGGPVMNDKGEVVGMATMGAEVQGFNFAVPTSVITEFVRAAGVTTQTSIFDRTWRAGLDHFYGAGSLTGRNQRDAYQSAIASFDEVLRILPDLPDAVSLRQEAIRRRDQVGPTAERSPLLLILAGVLVLGMVLVGAGLWLRKKNADGQSWQPAGKMEKPSGRLVVTAGPLQGNQFPVSTRGLRIGRDPGTCQIVLAESTVSREHAVLTVTGSKNGEVSVSIKNLSGTNSTFVNDRAIQEAALRPGDRIKIGNNTLSYEYTKGE
jgi:S1-C subfamily serine protease